ncbi:MAG TPA: PaaI family thioesterase [Syntrophomonadaceae bacterium]|nr:PaaI family thioesterase [Syntrophomonadaceae bacterium]
MNEQPNSRCCFLCGVENRQGMRLTWFSDFEQGVVWTEVEIAPFYNGYPGVTHGGIVAALLDETSFRAIALEEKDSFLLDNLFVTGSLNIHYHHPTPTGQLLKVVGWIRRAGKSRYETAAEIRLADGTVTAECKALVLQPPGSFAEEVGFSSEWPSRQD